MSLVSTSRSLVFAGLLFGLLLAGCSGGGSDEYRVTGSVTFDGQPVEQGEMIFFTSEMQPYVTRITAGQFECYLPEGRKRVEITATRESPTPAPDGLPNYESYIPAAYNTDSELTAQIEAGRENTLNFDLQPRPTGR